MLIRILVIIIIYLLHFVIERWVIFSNPTLILMLNFYHWYLTPDIILISRKISNSFCFTINFGNRWCKRTIPQPKNRDWKGKFLKINSGDTNSCALISRISKSFDQFDPNLAWEYRDTRECP
jgi:hypothetical protein